jgi:pyruvate,water dikinase
VDKRIRLRLKLPASREGHMVRRLYGEGAMPDVYVGHRRDTGEPVDFPVEWRNEEQAKQLWRWDAEHGPLPLTPLAGDVLHRAPGMDSATISLGGEARGGGGNMLIHGFRYGGGGRGGGGAPGAGGGAPAGRGGGAPAAGGPPAGGGSTQRFNETVSRLAPQVVDLWENTWRPIIENESRAVEEADYSALSLSELTHQLEKLIEQHALHADYMFRASTLTGYLRRNFVEFLREKDIDEAEALATELLQGVPTPSFQSAVALWDVVGQARANPGLATALRAAAESGDTDAIAAAPGGPEFLSAFYDWLYNYGRRNGGFGELADASWYEDPRVALSVACNYLDSEDPRLAHARAVARREELTREVEGRLDVADRPRFQELFALALPWLSIKESRIFTFNGSRNALRVPLLAIGQRLVESGVVAQPDDVFFLHLGEIHVAALKPSSMQAEVAERRAAHEHWHNVLPPETIGEAAPRETLSASEVSGIAASAGQVRGTARVILSIEEGHRLKPGEILVTRSTSPLWTPLFAEAAAVVTDGGGMLSHCAVVAREYRIPAVVGTHSATSVIKDGSLIEVDGSAGKVRLADR